MEQWIETLPQQKWFTKLLGYSFLVKYKKGKENKAADALSRREESLGIQPEDALIQYSGDAHAQQGSLFLNSFPNPT